VDHDGQPIQNSNRLLCKLEVYSAERVPRLLSTNRAGEKLLRGLTEREIIDGRSYFDKIRFEEVSSHFPNGCVYLVASVYSATSSIKTNADQSMIGTHKYINPKLLKPLILDKISVKAKSSHHIEQEF
jgi:hypothetical protein